MMEENKIKELNKKAWQGNKLIKWIHPDNLPTKWLRFPRGFGYAWIQWGKNKQRLRAIYLPVPFNWIVRKARALYARIRFGKQEEYAEMVYSKRAGFREGIETGVAICKQSKNLGEAEQKLKDCLRW